MSLCHYHSMLHYGNPTNWTVANFSANMYKELEKHILEIDSEPCTFRIYIFLFWHFICLQFHFNLLNKIIFYFTALPQNLVKVIIRGFCGGLRCMRLKRNKSFSKKRDWLIKLSLSIWHRIVLFCTKIHYHTFTVI